MFSPILIGMVAALVGFAPKFIRITFPNVNWSAAFFVFLVAGVALLLRHYVVRRKPDNAPYNGFADLLLRVHSPSNSDMPLRWLGRAIISFLLALFGGIVGAEGAAIESAHAVGMKRRSRSSRWFEQRRRTDVATAIAAGIAAVFSAPFAAVLLALELGVGGKAISAAMSAVTAFLSVKFLSSFLPTDKLGQEGFDLAGVLYGFRFTNPKEWLAVLVIAILSGIVGFIIIKLIRYSQNSLLDICHNRNWIRILVAAILLFFVILIYRSIHLPSPVSLEQVLWSKKAVNEVALLFVSQLITLAIVLAGFGTAGIVWPILALGGFFGYLIDQLIFSSVSGFSPVAGLVGAVGFLGAVFGVPFAASVLVFELTQNINVLLPCLVAAFIAKKVRLALKSRGLIDKDLEARGVSLVDGRSAAVLDSVSIRDAMVTDHETVNEREPISELHSRMKNLRYPFIPVTNAADKYVGLLTADMIQEGWQLQDPLASNSPLSKLLEAKDLLYRLGFKVPTIKISDHISITSRYFELIPCVPVLSDDNKVMGLLFAHNVRLAYDREVAKRALAFRASAN